MTRMDKWQRQIEETLDTLWEIRRKELTSAVYQGPGRPPAELDKQRRNDLIEQVLDLAEKALQPMAEKEFERLVDDKTNRRRRPRLRKLGRLSWNKPEEFLDGFSEDLESDYQVYIFWNGKKCVYVGQTTRGVYKGGGKWRADLWRKSTHLQIFSTRNKKDLDKFECLAIHRWNPEENQNDPPTKDYHSKCPIHKIKQYLNDELRYTFALRD